MSEVDKLREELLKKDITVLKAMKTRMQNEIKDKPQDDPKVIEKKQKIELIVQILDKPKEFIEPKLEVNSDKKMDKILKLEQLIMSDKKLTEAQKTVELQKLKDLYFIAPPTGGIVYSPETLQMLRRYDLIDDGSSTSESSAGAAIAATARNIFMDSASEVSNTSAPSAAPSVKTSIPTVSSIPSSQMINPEVSEASFDLGLYGEEEKVPEVKKIIDKDLNPFDKEALDMINLNNRLIVQLTNKMNTETEPYTKELYDNSIKQLLNINEELQRKIDAQSLGPDDYDRNSVSDLISENETLFKNEKIKLILDQLTITDDVSASLQDVPKSPISFYKKKEPLVVGAQVPLSPILAQNRKRPQIVPLSPLLVPEANPLSVPLSPISVFKKREPVPVSLSPITIPGVRDPPNYTVPVSPMANPIIDTSIATTREPQVLTLDETQVGGAIPEVEEKADYSVGSAEPPFDDPSVYDVSVSASDPSSVPEQQPQPTENQETPMQQQDFFTPVYHKVSFDILYGSKEPIVDKQKLEHLQSMNYNATTYKVLCNMTIKEYGNKIYVPRIIKGDKQEFIELFLLRHKVDNPTSDRVAVPLKSLLNIVNVSEMGVPPEADPFVEAGTATVQAQPMNAPSMGQRQPPLMKKEQFKIVKNSLGNLVIIKAAEERQERGIYEPWLDGHTGSEQNGLVNIKTAGPEPEYAQELPMFSFNISDKLTKKITIREKKC